MLSINNPKIIIRFALLLALLIFYDFFLDLLLSLLHSLVMLLHYLFEFCEHTLDHFIGHIFHTDPRTTEIIVFYVMAFAIGFIVFRVIMALPEWYRNICDRLTDYWHQEKTKALSNWRKQPFVKKIQWGSVFLTSSVFMVLWVFS